jgi:hypothetical protein
MQGLGVDGYYPEQVIADWQQIGIYKLPLGSVSNQNNPGVLRRDFVGNLYNGPNVYMPIWSAPTRGAVVNQTGGMVVVPMAAYTSGQFQANPITVNADQASIAAQFVASQSPRYVGTFSQSGGE